MGEDRASVTFPSVVCPLTFVVSYRGFRIICFQTPFPNFTPPPPPSSSRTTISGGCLLTRDLSHRAQPFACSVFPPLPPLIPQTFSIFVRSNVALKRKSKGSTRRFFVFSRGPDQIRNISFFVFLIGSPTKNPGEGRRLGRFWMY